MPFDTGIPTKEGFPKVTAEEIAAGFKEFLAIVNSPIEVYRNTKANSVFLINKVFENSGTDALIFGGSYLEAFHLYAQELPDQVQSPDEKLRAAKEAEVDRAVELEAKDREAGRPFTKHVDPEEAKKAQQEAYERTKAELQERVNQIRNAASEPVVAPTAADALAALKSTDLSRAAIVGWLKAFPNNIIREVRAFPFDRKTERTWGSKIDAIVAGKE